MGVWGQDGVVEGVLKFDATFWAHPGVGLVIICHAETCRHQLRVAHLDPIVEEGEAVIIMAKFKQFF